MLWYRSWLDSRRRFFIAAAASLIAAFGVAASHGELEWLAGLDGSSAQDDALGWTGAESFERATFHDYVWAHWFDQALLVLGVLFAALLGSGDPRPRGATRAQTESAVSATAHRSQWLVARAGVGAVQLFMLTVVPSLALGLVSSAIREPFPVQDAIIHGLCAFGVTLLFFSIAMLLSTWFSGYWRPLALTLFLAVVVAIVERVLQTPTAPFVTMSGESYFRMGAVPAEGLGASIALAAALLFVAIRRLERRGA